MRGPNFSKNKTLKKTLKFDYVNHKKFNIKKQRGFGSFLQSVDILTSEFSDKINFDGKELYKSKIGGFLSVLLFVIIFVFESETIHKLMNSYNPYIATINQAIDPNSAIGLGKYSLQKLNKFFLTAVDSDDIQVSYDEFYPYMRMKIIYYEQNADGVI